MGFLCLGLRDVNYLRHPFSLKGSVDTKVSIITESCKRILFYAKSKFGRFAGYIYHGKGNIGFKFVERFITIELSSIIQ